MPQDPRIAMSPTIAPPTAAPLAPTIAPPTAAPALTQFDYSPTISVREPSFLSGPDVQAALKEDFMQRLQTGTKTRQRQRNAEIGTKIFQSTIAPALTFIGNGDAGVALIKEAENRVKEGRQQAQNDELAAQQGMKSIANIVNTASIKPLTEAFKARNRYINTVKKESGKNDRLNKQIEARKERDASKAQTQQELLAQRHQNTLEKLDKEQIFTRQEHDKLREMKDRFHSDSVALRKLEAKVRLGQASAKEQARIQEMKQKQLKDLRDFQLKVEEQNIDTEVKLQQKTKDGFKFADKEGNPLDPEQFKMQVNNELMTLPNGSTVLDTIQSLQQEVDQFQAQQPAAQPAQEQKAQTPVSNVFASRIKEGADPEDLKSRTIQALMRRGLSFKDAQATVQGLK